MESSTNVKHDKAIQSTLWGGVLKNLIVLSVIIFILLLLSGENYGFFHMIMELFSSIIGISILIISGNTYKISKNKSLLVLGIGYGFVAFFDIFHALVYKGTGIIDVGSANMPTQFWIAARYLEALTLLVSSLFFTSRLKRIKIRLVIFIYLTLSTFLFLGIYYLEIFPDCYIDGRGLTSFKIISEYVVSIILFISMVIQYRLKEYGDSYLLNLMMISIGTTIISEILFTMYKDPYGFANMLGHIFKVISFYFIYKAVVETGLKEPYKLLFKELDRTAYDLEKKAFELESVVEMLETESVERKNMEDILMRNERCCNLLIDNSPIAIIVHSDGKLVFANNKAAAILGISNPEELIGEEVIDLIAPEYRKTYIRNVQEIYENNRPMPFMESGIINTEGEVLSVEVSRTSFNYRGKHAILSILKDVTSIKQVENLKKVVKQNEKLLNETREFNKLITEFFSNISHELKTPLNVILGTQQILSMYGVDKLKIDDNERLNKYLKSIKQNCYRLLRLVNNLIDLSKIDSGFLKLHLENHNIVSIVENITLSVAEFIESKGVELIFDTDVEEKITACDPDKMERVILNLLSNSIKFTNPGDSITVNIMDKEEDIIISVKDTGIGIPEDKMNVIFERFRQVDKSLTKNREGSGIGLSLVKSIVEMHGGRIDVKSVLGEGSEFIIILPVKVLDEEIHFGDERQNASNIERISVEFSGIYS